MQKTKIDWCDFSWNPVWGCNNNCSYCYARKMAYRFGDKDFKPTWKEKNFQKPMPKKPSRIFVNSMSDIAFWENEWLEKVLRRIKDFPQHSFLFLTKRPDIYMFIEDEAPKNCWFGTTITKNGFPEIPLSTSHINFISIEPILESINLGARHIPEKPLDWIICGAETGNRKDKIIPKKYWIMYLVGYAKYHNIPIFMKENLRYVWGDNLIQEFPQ